jgi:hypothetical protein
MAELVECATGAIVEEAVEELEHEIFEWWVKLDLVLLTPLLILAPARWPISCYVHIHSLSKMAILSKFKLQ